MPTPWSAAQLRAELAAGNGLSWVGERREEIAGYVFFRTCRPESELLHLVVAHGHRRRGLAEALLRHGLEHLVAAGYGTCLLEVRSSNAAARQLYAKMGFFQVGRRAKYYRQPIEDALLLQRDLIEMSEEDHENTARY
jgi:ribosomal-protein-alanine N-acetyltransferase